MTVDGVTEQIGWSHQDCWNQLYRWPSCLDLYHLLGADFVSLNAVRVELLETQADHDGKDVAKYFQSGEYDLIEEYVRDELVAMATVYEALRELSLFDELMDFRRRIGLDRDLA